MINLSKNRSQREVSAGVSSPTRELYFTHTPGQTQYNMRMPLNLGGRNIPPSAMRQARSYQTGHHQVTQSRKVLALRCPGVKAPQPTYFGTGQFGNTWRHHTSSTQQVHHASRNASREKRRVDSLVERRTGHLFIVKYRKIPPPLNYEIKIFLCPIQLSRQTGPFSGAYLKGLRW